MKWKLYVGLKLAIHFLFFFIAVMLLYLFEDKLQGLLCTLLASIPSLLTLIDDLKNLTEKGEKGVPLWRERFIEAYKQVDNEVGHFQKMIANPEYGIGKKHAEQTSFKEVEKYVGALKRYWATWPLASQICREATINLRHVGREKDVVKLVLLWNKLQRRIKWWIGDTDVLKRR
jgi:hypothetical protein